MPAAAWRVVLSCWQTVMELRTDRLIDLTLCGEEDASGPLLQVHDAHLLPPG
jgi:hypothetical protein